MAGNDNNIKTNVGSSNNINGRAFETPNPERIPSTSLFRAINFELFVKPNRFVMYAGIVAFGSCLAYIAYWRATGQHKKETYMALTEKGQLEKMYRSSRWD